MAYKVIYAFITAFILFVSGCRTTRAGVDQAVLEYQRQITEYQVRIEARERAIGECVREIEDIRNRARTMEGTIDTVIELFDEYQRAVERLLRQIDKSRIEQPTFNKDSSAID